MRSRKAGLPFATRARKRKPCPQRYVSRITRTENFLSQNIFQSFSGNHFSKKKYPAKIRQIFSKTGPEPDFEAGYPAGTGFSQISGRFLVKTNFGNFVKHAGPPKKAWQGNAHFSLQNSCRKTDEFFSIKLLFPQFFIG